MQNTKVAMLGKLDTKFKAPFEDDTWDIWTLNYHKNEDMIPRYTEWFDIHTKNPNPKATITRANYPFEEATKMLGGNYFNNTVAYMIAYAIIKGYKEIALYGMRFDSNDEKRKQEYHNVRELIFFAKAKGVMVTAPEDYVMIKPYQPYGI